MNVLTDPAECGPVTLALCQDVQAEAYDYPESFFAERVWTPRRARPDAAELSAAVAAALQGRKAPLIVAGGGVPIRDADGGAAAFAERHGIPVAETQAGKSALPHDHPLNMGAIGVTGTSAANALAAEADLVLAVGTRLQDFTTGSWALFGNPARRIIGAQRAALRCRQASRAAAGLRCQGRPRGAVERASGPMSRRKRWTEQAQRRQGATG